MITKIAYTLVFGKPLIFYTGILTVLAFWFTALIGYLNFHGHRVIPFKWHPVMAVSAIGVSVIHALFGLSIYLNL